MRQEKYPPPKQDEVVAFDITLRLMPAAGPDGDVHRDLVLILVGAGSENQQQAGEWQAEEDGVHE
jgi:hypothetical protein